MRPTYFDTELNPSQVHEINPINLGRVSWNRRLDFGKLGSWVEKFKLTNISNE